jgi:fused signal recognition particle receptor
VFNFLAILKHTSKNILGIFAQQSTVYASSIERKQALEKLLYAADVGPRTTKKLVHTLEQKLTTVVNQTQQTTIIKETLVTLLSQQTYKLNNPVILCVGINGSGKTSALIKLANFLRRDNKKVLLAAADTFRAAGAQQLTEQAQYYGLETVSGSPGQDPASVVYQACEQFEAQKHNYLLIDTAGRLQSNTNLMNELAKIKRIIAKKLGADATTTLLVLDSMLGQNSFSQAQIFHEQLAIDGIILTKLDGAAKGGIIFAIIQELQLPIAYITYGIGLQDIAPFDAQQFVDKFLT